MPTTRLKIVDAFRVVCTETGSFSHERSCLPFIVTFEMIDLPLRHPQLFKRNVSHGVVIFHVLPQARRDRSKSLKEMSGTDFHILFFGIQRNCKGAGHALMKRAAHAAVDGNADPSLYDPSV